MAIEAGRHQFATERGRIVLKTFRDGLASQAGHDLTIEAGRWSGEFKRYSAFLGALRVRDDVDVEIDIDLREPAGPGRHRRDRPGR